MKRGFTLLELVLVIAILAIISTLAVSKVGDMREKAARTVSIANQQAVGRAVETYLAVNGAGKANRLNRLDGLMDYRGRAASDEGAAGAGFEFTLTADDIFYRGPDAERLPTDGSLTAEDNQGLTPGLRNVLAPYALSAAEKSALRDLGLGLVMRHYTDATRVPREEYPDGGEDGVLLPNELVGRDPDESACMPTPLTNDTFRLVAAVSPKTPAGRDVYRDFGYSIFNTQTSDTLTDQQARDEVKNAGGPLVAFGLGRYASIVGSLEGGLEALPTCAYPARRYYRRYVLLFRLRTVGNHCVADFAGVLDSCGQTIRAARAAMK